MTRYRPNYWLALVCITLLSGCDNNETASIVNSGWRSASSGEIRVEFEGFSQYSQSFEHFRALLHAEDANTILADIDLLQTGGIADFGSPPEGPVHLSIAVQWRDADAWLLQSLLEFPRGRYRVPAPAISQLQNSVLIDVDVDAQAINGGATSAGVSASDWLASRSWAIPSSTSFTFEDFPARQSPGVILAWAADAQADEVLFSLRREDQLIANNRYVMVVDQAAQGIDVSERGPNTDVYGFSFLPDLVYGPFVFLDSGSSTASLNILTAEAGEQVVLSASRPAAESEFNWLRLEGAQTPPPVYTPSFWEAAVDLGDYDSSTYTLAFNQTAAEPALSASSCGVSIRNDVATWCLYAPATRQEITVPRLPADLAAQVDRDQLQGMRESFQLAREDNYSNYSAWVRDAVQRRDNMGGASLLSVAAQMSADIQEPSCLVELPALGLCLNLPSTIEAPTAQRRQIPPHIHRPTLFPSDGYADGRSGR
nr:hypothetical protein [Oceanococcus sp. HetDA_MAG_MS8]